MRKEYDDDCVIVHTEQSVRCNRRAFIKNIAVGGSALFLLGNLGLLGLGGCANTYTMITVDYHACAGCRTCETVCSAFANKRIIDGEILNGLGNPSQSNLQVYHFNPDVTITNVCAMCPDAPCIEACPVSPDFITGHKALYRDNRTLAIKLDHARCDGCGRCATACKSRRVGIITLNPTTKKPERLCTLCDGDPQCVHYCPQKALSYRMVNTRQEFYGMNPEAIASELARRWYHGLT